jgi:hypothetical protein
MLGALAYRDRVVSLDYQKLLLRAPYASETLAGEGVLAGGVPTLQTPDETLLITILTTPEYYTGAGGTDNDFLARTIDDLLARQGSAEEESAYLQRSVVHDTAWQTAVAEAILDGSEYRTDFVRGVYETYLTFSDCATNASVAQDNPDLPGNIAGTLMVGVLVGALIIGIAVPTILRQRRR